MSHIRCFVWNSSSLRADGWFPSFSETLRICVNLLRLSKGSWAEPTVAAPAQKTLPPCKVALPLFDLMLTFPISFPNNNSFKSHGTCSSPDPIHQYHSINFLEVSSKYTSIVYGPQKPPGRSQHALVPSINHTSQSHVYYQLCLMEVKEACGSLCP